jgi:dTDP-4-amino-4,6-dideoxygalactose transaminase
MKVPLTRINIDKSEMAEVARVLKSGWVTQGPETVAFENSVARYLGIPHALACSSCTTALFAMMKAAGIGPGDEVIVPSLTFIATPNSVRHTGATPVFADVSAGNYNMDPESVRRKIGKKTRAILVVHQIGIPADLGSLARIARAHKILLLEDAACAIGSVYRGKKIGNTGHSFAASFSFHPRKVITTGEGGMVVSRNRKFIDDVRMLISHGASVDELVKHKSKRLVDTTYPIVGYNFRLSDILSAVGVVQMRKLEALIAKREKHVRYYKKALAKIPGIVFPDIPRGDRWNCQSCAVRITDAFGPTRDRVLEYCLQKGIAARGSITVCHKEPPYVKAKTFLPETDRVAREVLMLPLYPGMSVHEQDYVVSRIKECAP